MKPATQPRRSRWLRSRDTRFLPLADLALLAVSIWPAVGQQQGKGKPFLGPLSG